MNNKILSILVVIALILGILGILFPKSIVSLGGSVHNAFETFDEGIGVDGTTVIDGSRNITAVDITASDDMIVTDDLIVGGATASQSSLVGEFIGTATVSVGFTSNGSGTEGTCLVMKNNIGVLTYVRIVGTTLTATTVSCK